MSFKIGIDAGHGGRDSGAVGLKGTKEKDITLGISLWLEQLLHKSNFKTVLTRHTDKHLGANDRQDLSARTNLFNNSKCDYAISIHTDASINRTANYFSVYVYGLGGESEKLAKSVASEIKSITGWNWGGVPDGVRVKNLHMVRETNMPSILVECGFISNPTQEELLKQNNTQYKLAKGIYSGLLKHLEIEGVDKMVYKTFNDLPSWAKPTIKKLMDRETIKGDDKGNLNLSEDMVRVFVILDRENVFK